MDFSGRRVTIMGLGHFGGGVAAARWLARQGAVVTVTDLADDATLADSRAALADESIARFVMGGHREEDFCDAELVVVNPAVRPGDRWLQIARESGARLSSEIELFMEDCPTRIIGVTGSNGKSTTAAMTAAILRADGKRVWLGGNIGNSLLGDLAEIGPDDWVVLELSSFQLWHLHAEARRPHVAVVTGCSPNHLDWHGTYEHYVAAKQRILTGQTADDLAMLNPSDAEVAAWGHLVRGRLVTLPAVGRIPSLSVPGEHNRINAACAAAAAIGAGCSETAIRQALETFHALPGRLERFAVIEGRRFYNDSTATTPESTIAALESLDEPIWLLAGGRDKGCDFTDLTATITQKARGAAFFGSTAAKLQRLLAERTAQVRCTAAQTLAETLAWCWERSRPGDAIVLSPACASDGQFRNFRQRGQAFVELVSILDDPRNR